VSAHEFPDNFIEMMKRFRDGSMDAPAFVAEFLGTFKAETAQMPDDVYECLNRVFGDADCYTADPELLTEGDGFYIDEQALRTSVASAIRDLARPKRVG
jgi:hypothetical protein